MIHDQESTPAGAPDRRLALEGLYNLRDLGGYPAAGGWTRWRTVWRSDSMHRLSPAGQQALLDLGVQTIIDLRYREELAESPNVFAGSGAVTYSPLALYELSDPRVVEYAPQKLIGIYRLILDVGQASIRQVFEMLSAPGALPAVFHCMAGKDRTGIVAALILGAVGVPEAVIVEDYALSARYLDPLFDEWRLQAAQAGYDMDWYNGLLETNPETMRQALAYLDRKYGGVLAYLGDIGVGAQTLARLQSALVTNSL